MLVRDVGSIDVMATRELTEVIVRTKKILQNGCHVFPAVKELVMNRVALAIKQSPPC